jgi:agmatinase
MELPLAGVDVVEVSPPYDHAEITAFLANRVVLEALSGIAWRRRREAADPARPARLPHTALLHDRPARQDTADDMRPTQQGDL